jgi:NAD(P)-dependent dehydrogenase (short-subunit alcohol dehydrogenase family)
MQMKGLEGKIALVTGGSSGIGRAAVLAFASQGARVVVADIDSGGGAETVRMVEESGGEAVFVKADVSQREEVEALVKKAVDTYGRLDCAFNNAGVEAAQGLAMFMDCPDGELERLLAVNLKGVWNCLKSEIAQMLKQGGGAIVNTASVAGLVGFQLSAAYVASKHGVVGLTKAVALDYAPAGIRVNAICPGVTRTPMVDELIGSDAELEATIVGVHPLARLADPQEVARTAVWLCSDEASFVTGVALPVDGGLVAQ